MNPVPITTLIGFVMYVAKRSGFVPLMGKRLGQWFFRYQYPVHRVPPRRRRLQRLMNKVMGHLRRRTGMKGVELESLMKSLATRTQSILDAVEDFRNPMNTLNISEESVPSVNTILDHCSLHRPLPFWLAVPFYKQACAKKIAEGSYGEIYLTEHLDGTPRIMKFITVHSRLSDGTPNISFDGPILDIVCSKYLSSLKNGRMNRAPNFPFLHGISLVKGPFPEMLTKAWLNFKMNRITHGTATNFPKPDRNDKDQFFVVLEFDHCGEDLESQKHIFVNDPVACAVCICQIAAALAVAESAFRFEHRDLHIGNVLIKQTDELSLKYALFGREFNVESYGFHSYIIDYSISRISAGEKTYSVPVMPSEPSASTEPQWADMDEVYNRQADICNENWGKYNPKTNLLWLRHLIEYMSDLLQRKWHSHRQRKNEEQLTALMLLEKWRAIVLHYTSAMVFFEMEMMRNTPYISH